jgi:hypothetical protein
MHRASRRLALAATMISAGVVGCSRESPAPTGPESSGVRLAPKLAHAVGDIVLSDGDFNPADWSHLLARDAAAGSATPTLVPTGGNPGAFRQIQIIGGANVLSFSAYGTTYDPSTQGPITSLDYSEDHRLIFCSFSCGGQLTGPAIRQGGAIYINQLDFTNSTSWKAAARSGLTATSFFLQVPAGTTTIAPNFSMRPDFSSSGGPIEFGFFRQTTGSGERVAGIDNWSFTIHRIPTVVNQPPVANAGPDQTFACATGASMAVTLDGSASSDPDGDALAYEWRRGGSVIATGATPTVSLAVGTHTLALTVRDPSGASSTDDVTITIGAGAPPTLTLSASPGELWPRNHKYVPVALTLAYQVTCGPATVIAEAVSSEPDDANGNGDGNTTGDIRALSPGGTASVSSNTSPTVSFNPLLDQLELRAETSPQGGGRSYTITVRVTDGAGNVATRTVAVTVPRSR